MRRDVMWMAIGTGVITLVIKLWAYLPHAGSQSKGESMCEKSGGKVIGRTINKDKDFLVFKEGEYILICYTPKTDLKVVIDIEGKYLCGEDDKCYDMATQKPITVWSGE